MRTSVAVALCSVLFLRVIAAEQLTGVRVVGVHDGDTLTVIAGEKQIKVRLHGIDAPELGQPFGRKAKSALSELVHGRTVNIDVMDTDQYGRTVGRVWIADNDINLEMVESGLAWWYRQFAPEDKDLEQAELRARNKKLGLWADPEPLPPWRWRATGRARKKGG